MANKEVPPTVKKTVKTAAQGTGRKVGTSSGTSAAQKSLKQARTTERKNQQKKKGAKQPLQIGRIVYGVLVTLAALALAFFIWARAQNELSVPENAVGSLLSPVLNAVNRGTAWMRDTVDGWKNRNQLRADYEEAQLEIIALNYRISQLEEQEEENIRLRGLVEAKQRYSELAPIHARVVAKESGRWFDVFSINRGTSSGVKVGMAVISEDGLVGRIYEAGLNYSKVLTIIDSRSAVACLIQRTRDNGVMKGKISASSVDSSFNMYYIPMVNDIVPGDEIITSGLDGLYPKGLVVGTVREVSRQSDVSDQYVVVSPAADFERLEDVLVLRAEIEAVDEVLSPLPSPTTRAKPTPNVTATPGPHGTPQPTPVPNNNWAYPQATVDPHATNAPIVGGVRPEEQWAQSE